MSEDNRQWLLARRPKGLPVKDDYEWHIDAVPEPGEGQFLVRVLYVSMDPALRTYMHEGKSGADAYMAPIPLGTPVRAFVLGKVVKSRHDAYPVGMIVSGFGAWADYVVGSPELLGPVPVEWGHDLSAYLHPLGLNVGGTAYVGLFEVAGLKDGETVLVSGAAGGVGSMVGQFAKIRGCRVVGIAGGPKKCAWLTDELGFDAAVDYRATDDLSAALGKVLPSGFNVYFENVGGPALEAALDHLAERARIAICGMISGYNKLGQLPPGPRNLWHLLIRGARMEGFRTADHLDRVPAGFAQINQWIKDGRLKFKIDLREGLEKVPETFNCLFDGSHDGKLMVRIAEDA